MIRIFSVFGDEVLSYREAIPESVFSKNIMLTVAEEDGTMVGLLAASASKNNDLHIRYIIVTNDHKRKGTGRAMIAYTRQVAAAMGLSRILANYVKDSETADLDSFFEATGFNKTESGGLYTIDISLSAETLDDHRDEIAEYRIITLSTATNAQYNMIRDGLKKLRDKSTPDQRDIYLDPGDRSRYRGDISFIAYDKDNRPRGIILFRDTDMGVVLEYICVFAKNSGPCMLALLAAAGSYVLDNWSVKETNKKMYFHGYNSAIYGIAKKLGLRCKKAGDSVWMEMAV